MIIACIISFVVGAFAMLCAIGLMSCQKDKNPQNKVRFYVVVEKKNLTSYYEHENIWLFLGKPERCKETWNDVHGKALRILPGYAFEKYGLHVIDYTNLKFEDEPVEVFLNLED